MYLSVFKIMFLISFVFLEGKAEAYINKEKLDLKKEMSELSKDLIQARLLYLKSCEIYKFFKQKSVLKQDTDSMKSNCKKAMTDYIKKNKEFNNIAREKVKSNLEKMLKRALEESKGS